MAISSVERNAIPVIERKLSQLTPEYLTTLAKLSPGKKVTDPRLHVTIAGVSFGNPVMIAPDGTNYEGSVISELHEAGFSGIEIGSVPVTQSLLSKPPRTIDVRRGEIIYRLNLYSPISIDSLKNTEWNGVPVGINLSKNSEVPYEAAPDAFATSVERLYDNASYFCR